VADLKDTLKRDKAVYIPFPVRLQRGAAQWMTYTKSMRETRNNMLRHYANSWFGGGASHITMPINLIDRGVSILVPFLVSQNPKVLVQPKGGMNNTNLHPFAYTLELALNHLLDEIELAGNTLRPVVIDSFFAMGITKTGVMHEYDVELGGEKTAVGQPYCNRIDFDDYICDISARIRTEAKFEGHKYRLPIKYVAESGLFKNWEGLQPDLNILGDQTAPESISRDGKLSFEYRELHPSVELIDIYVPDEHIIVTIPPEGCGNQILRTVEWDGPEGGPFDVLGYKWFPGSVIPIPPAYSWLDTNKLVNVMIAKMRDMVEREKTIGIFDQSNDEDAKVVQNSGHGDMVGLKGGGADSVKEVTFGGFNPQSFPFLSFMLQQWAKSGPNLDITGGNNSQAGTLGQEQMLQNNALREVDDMQNQCYTFTTSIIKKLAWFLWTDPLKVIPVIKRLGNIEVPVEYSDSAKDGDFVDYSFDISPYSMGRMNPDLRYQRMIQLVSQVIMPLIPIAQSQGSAPDVDKLVEEAGRYLNVDTSRFWKPGIPQPPAPQPYGPEQGSVGGPGMADNRFGGGQDEASKEADLMQQQTRMGGMFEKTSNEGASK
jgi:hypothetical protein